MDVVVASVEAYLVAVNKFLRCKESVMHSQGIQIFELFWTCVRWKKSENNQKLLPMYSIPTC